MTLIGKQNLTAEQQRIVDRIQELYLSGKPLNIWAMKRREPELLAAVMAVKPYWGWRRALKAAGIDYGDFEEELSSEVTCHICGRSMRQLTTHLQRTHGVSSEAYRSEFPGAEIKCEQLRTMRATDRLEEDEYALPHWESLWSYEYVLDRIALRWELGHPLTTPWIEVHDSNLVHQAYLKGESWEESLLAAGVDPETTRLIRALGAGSDAWLLNELRERHVAGLALAEAHVRRVQPPLHDEVVRRFGGWSEGLARAEIPLEDIARAPDPTRLEQMLAEARAVAALDGDPHRRELRAFRARWESFGLASLGSWRRVAEETGVPVEQLHRSHMEHVYQSPQALLDEIRRRYRAGIPFHKSAVDGGSDGVRDYAINDSACRFFGSYQKALEAAAKAENDAGLLQAGIRPLRLAYADENAVVAEIGRRASEGLSLLVKDVQRQDDALYLCARRFFPDWHAAIRAAGYNPAELGLGVEQRRGVRARYEDEQSVLAEVRRRIAVGLPVNAQAIRVAGPEPDPPLLRAAQRYFRKWENALRSAGIDPSSVAPRPVSRSRTRSAPAQAQPAESSTVSAADESA